VFEQLSLQLVAPPQPAPQLAAVVQAFAAATS